MKLQGKIVEKILIGLLALALVSAGVLFVRNHNLQKTVDVNQTPTPIPTSSSTPTPASVSPDEIRHMDALVTPFSNKKYAPITPDNASGFKSSWVLQNNTGDSWADIAFNYAHIDVYNGGENNEGVIFYRDGIPFSGGTSYSIFFNLSAVHERDIDVVIVDADDATPIYRETIHVNGTLNNYTLSFVSPVTSWNGSVRFLLGGGQENTYDLNELRITGSSEIAIRTNHLGYQANSQKRCTFTYSAGDLFDVVRADTNEIVYSGAILNEAWNDYTGENNSYGDFTNVMEPGEYYVRAQIGVVSHPFVIE